MFGTILCVLLKSLVLTKATVTTMTKDYITPNSFQEEYVSMYPDLNFTQDISTSEKSDDHILNFNLDRSYSDSTTVRNERVVDEVSIDNTSMMPESIERWLSKPTSLRAFVEFSQQRFKKEVDDIFVTLRWNQPEYLYKVQKYTVQYFEHLKENQICDDKNITTLEHTVRNLKPNTTYYFRVRAHIEDIDSLYTDLIDVSTTHENPIPKLLITTTKGIDVLDIDSKTIINLVQEFLVTGIAYCPQEHRIYWTSYSNLMTLEINKNITTRIYRFPYFLSNVCLDWVARNLYLEITDITDSIFHIIKFDLTMWENGIIKYDKIYKIELNYNPSNIRWTSLSFINTSPFMGILYFKTYNFDNTNNNIMQCDLDGENAQIVQLNSSNICSCKFNTSFDYMQIDDTNNEKPLIYLVKNNYIIVTDINVCMCNTLLHNKTMRDEEKYGPIKIDKINIYISIIFEDMYYLKYLYILKKKYAFLDSVNVFQYVQEIKVPSHESEYFYYFKMHNAFDRSLAYPPTKCLTPDKIIYNFEQVIVKKQSIIVHFPVPVAKSECKKYNLPSSMYTIYISHCVDNNLNKSEEFYDHTFERYYKFENLTPFTEYKLKFTLSNNYFDKLSINPLESEMIQIKTDPGKLNAPENPSVQALTPTIAVVHWMSPKKLNCAAVIYEVYWKPVTLGNDTKQNGKQVINTPKRIANGRFFTKINISLLTQDYLIYVRVYPVNFSDFYNESSRRIIYSEPNKITLDEVDTNSMNISWIPDINMIVYPALEYKDVATEKWRRTNYSKINDNKEVIYHIENLQPGTSYKFRLIFIYFEYEEKFIWPHDERKFSFSTLGDISNSLEILETKYYLPLMLGSIVIVIVICVCYFYSLYRRRYNNEHLFPSIRTDMELAILPFQNTQINMLYSPMVHYNPDENAFTKIKRKQITLTKSLGSGAFGEVFQGNVKDLESSGIEIPAAIKMLRKDSSSNDKKKFLEEAKLMNHFRHKHILQLLAVCLDGDSPLIVLELMKTDLLKYLRDCRNLQASDSHALRLQDLLVICEDVARGCCYLEELRFVHRDLACRNCLVSSRNRENRVIKIGDFGLAKDIYKDDYYRQRGEGLFPVRWMAPESLVFGIFTSLSDVWSFGVLMWEITSLGEQPYVAKTNEEVINYIRGGNRLSMALNCPSTLYELMLRCWSAANARPNFKRCLKNIIELRENIEDASLSPVDVI